ncbi:MAG: hypothetical protein WBR15_10855 [Gammaproteobacteria bacterium]
MPTGPLRLPPPGRADPLVGKPDFNPAGVGGSAAKTVSTDDVECDGTISGVLP